jgi:Zn-dependent M28 family amino/carboxypeptidase
VAAILSQVSAPALQDDLAGLTGERAVIVGGSPYTITTRRTYDSADIAAATAYAYEQFDQAGLVVTYQNYAWIPDPTTSKRTPGGSGERAGRNVVAEKTGRADPKRIYLLTAHVDAMASGSRVPGADDNASGSVAVLTAARLLAPHDFAYTIRFVLFTGEEQGMQGSSEYAAACAARQDDIRGVINLDMLAYNSDAEPIVDLYASRDVPASVDLTRRFSIVIGVYRLPLTPQVDDTPDGFVNRSDQVSFLVRNYPAILAIEDWSDHTPHYHQASDRVSDLNMGYYADFTRAAIATIVHLAVLVR